MSPVPRLLVMCLMALFFEVTCKVQITPIILSAPKNTNRILSYSKTLFVKSTKWKSLQSLSYCQIHNGFNKQIYFAESLENKLQTSRYFINISACMSLRVNPFPSTTTIPQETMNSLIRSNKPCSNFLNCLPKCLL